MNTPLLERNEKLAIGTAAICIGALKALFRDQRGRGIQVSFDAQPEEGRVGALAGAGDVGRTAAGGAKGAEGGGRGVKRSA